MATCRQYMMKEMNTGEVMSANDILAMNGRVGNNDDGNNQGGISGLPLMQLGVGHVLAIVMIGFDASIFIVAAVCTSMHIQGLRCIQLCFAFPACPMEAVMFRHA